MSQQQANPNQNPSNPNQNPGQGAKPNDQDQRHQSPGKDADQRPANPQGDKR